MAAPRPIAPVLLIENDAGAPAGRLADWLRDAGAELDVRCGPAGDEIPATLAGYSALVVMGGAASAAGTRSDGRFSWLPAVSVLLRTAVAEESPCLALCLGAQLLAVACGGAVARAETPEYGAQLVAKRQVAATDPMFRELPITPDVIQWHAEEIVRLPADAVLLASSPVCEVEAFRLGRLAWGLQFHIETTPDVVRAWAAADAKRLADYDTATLVRRAIDAHEDIEETWRPFAARFVDVAREPGRLAGPKTLPMAGGGNVRGGEPITDPAAIRAALAAQMQASREHPRG